MVGPRLGGSVGTAVGKLDGTGVGGNSSTVIFSQRMSVYPSVSATVKQMRHDPSLQQDD